MDRRILVISLKSEITDGAAIEVFELLKAKFLYCECKDTP
ncbi:hypothetical protein JCM19301_529 [Jejuia pallidilutea]|uniref:Uncharacterized protein n=1 Tax=Jejuia pallidilutea TaxID=504487 RepID=A0A090VRP9_9FLAO|nr:hypothetical protein JCM19301_529 [Jejuia pallidilutea]GAL70641.1 hypothetical protein JCM19302_1550 [Jejuia pallidilutea]GAL88027.1 hypothetical protein JCM19538_2390 [Jejuia pallidilutea]